MSGKIRLGVNIDHVATIRNARGGEHPSPCKIAVLAEKSGADGITAHLREDRRHISEQDIFSLKKEINLPLNLEMALTEEMLNIALKTVPNAVCIVPEKREELTTEGGLNIKKYQKELLQYCQKLKAKNIKISLFLEANKETIEIAKKIGVDIIEFHTGKYCNLTDKKEKKEEFLKIEQAVKFANSLGIEAHLGHGMDYKTATELSKIAKVKEFNIGHFLIGEAIFDGLQEVIKKIKIAING